MTQEAEEGGSSEKENKEAPPTSRKRGGFDLSFGEGKFYLDKYTTKWYSKRITFLGGRR
jgi:hypothetical protein